MVPKRKNSRLQTTYQWSIIAAILVLVVSAQTGCSTLSALGLPFGRSNNEILKPAKAISDAPGRSLLVPKELAKQPMNSYFVEIADTILVEPVKFDASIRLPGDQVVKPDGQISIGEFGNYLAVNKTIEQIQSDVQALINDRLRRDLEVAFEIERRRRVEDKAELNDSSPDSDLNENELADLPLSTLADREERIALDRRIREALTQNEISVRLINWESKRIYVLGEVNSPGSFTYAGGETVLDAILEAGGLSLKANRHQIIVARPSTCSSCRTVMKVCYDQVVQLGDASTNYQLQPGDRVFVPALTFHDDVKKTFKLDQDDHCPRCSDCQLGCNLPTGCE